jgi:hypothetical protein
MGVNESQPSSMSMFRRDKLSTMTTSWPWSDRYNEVGQPQKPSPPNTKTFLFFLLLLLLLPFSTDTPLDFSNHKARENRASLLLVGAALLCCGRWCNPILVMGEKDETTTARKALIRTMGQDKDLILVSFLASISLK